MSTNNFAAVSVLGKGKCICATDAKYGMMEFRRCQRTQPMEPREQNSRGSARVVSWTFDGLLQRRMGTRLEQVHDQGKLHKRSCVEIVRNESYCPKSREVFGVQWMFLQNVYERGQPTIQYSLSLSTIKNLSTIESSSFILISKRSDSLESMTASQTSGL
jgi:hypothetical protein